MRIVIDARYLSGAPGGIATYSENLLRALSARDKANDYYCLVQPGYRTRPALGANFHWIVYAAQPLSFDTLFALHRLINRLKPDVFHSLFPIAPFFYTAPFVVTVHDAQPLLMRGWTGRRPWPLKLAYDAFYRWIYPNTFHRATALLSVSQATGMALAGLWPNLSGKIRVTSCGVDPDAAAPPCPDALRDLRRVAHLPKCYALYLGSTRPNKNLPAMLRAFARLPAIHAALSDVGFVLVLSQDRFFADVEETIAREGIQSRVTILPPVSPEEKRALLREAGALFFCTKFEGFGHPALEAQAQGTPVIAARHGALPESAGEGALYADPDDVDSMADALARALTDEELRRDLIAKGRSNLSRFSWDAAAGIVLETYESAVKRK